MSPRLLRYYQEQGLLAPERGSNGYREYGPDAPLLVAQIRGLLSAGLPTGVTRGILPCARGTEPELEPCPSLLATPREELAGIDARISCLRQNREALARYLGTAAAGDHTSSVV